MKFETKSIHIGRDIEANTGEVAPAIHLSTTYERDADGGYPRSYSYIRPDNPSRRALEECIAALEGGAVALAFASGSAASLAVFSLLRSGDHIIAPIESYHGTAKQLRDIVAQWGVECSFVDMTRIPEIQKALRTTTRLIWIETPSNPMLNMSDIRAITALAKTRDALVCCDNTFATPVLQLPFELGADLVIHSTTKYFGGHSDVMGGAVVVREAGALADRLRDYQGTSGAIPAPFDCWLVRRSLATLAWRMRAQTANAQRVAEFLSTHPRVARTFYPGLDAHPGHALARAQMHGGFGAMVSFCVQGGRDEAFEVAARMQIFIRATSLGGVESLVEHRASVEGPHSVTPDTLLRLSIGLEHADDLIADLDQALSG
ncbi:MAG: aminotransferase class I/II-fold pyridoxal phosphate-dependent enzyme [Steroidobacteraceae bacterium]